MKIYPYIVIPLTFRCDLVPIIVYIKSRIEFHNSYSGDKLVCGGGGGGVKESIYIRALLPSVNCDGGGGGMQSCTRVD